MVLNDLFKQAYQKGASDLHLIADRSPVLRIGGELMEIKEVPPLKATQIKTLVFGILSGAQQDKFNETKELDFAYEIEGIRFRVNLHWEKGNVGMAARVIPAKVPAMEELNMPEVAYGFARLAQGLVLVTGPTGHGKSTSMAAMIELINSEQACNIVTLEDPIEFLFTSKKSFIKQRELGMDMLSFQEGLKHILRQDPNVVMVGEMRDLETIATAITLAETGHLVLATLHTFNAAQTIDRIVDVFPPHQQQQIKIQLSATLAGIISQRLVPKKGGGRIAAREILINNMAIANLIREGKTEQIPTVIQTNGKKGMITMNTDLQNLLKKGLISEETLKTYSI